VPSELEPLPLCVELAPPSSLCVLLDEPEELGVVVAVLDVAPLPSAATATHAATKVASTPAVTRRRVVRKRCLTGGAGGCMPMMLADEAWIFLGIRSAPGKAAGAFGSAADLANHFGLDRTLDGRESRVTLAQRPAVAS
jgi:hypothetical protein